jgi:hypothetical protein
VIFTAVFTHWLIARHPAARRAAEGPGSAYQRLIGVCRDMVLEPWKDMVGASMAAEFHDVCARLNPAVEEQHRKVALECIAHILREEESATVFLLALDALLADEPTPAVLERTRCSPVDSRPAQALTIGPSHCPIGLPINPINQRQRALRQPKDAGYPERTEQ